MAAALINAERYAEAKSKSAGRVTARSFATDLHTVAGINLLAQIWTFADRAPRYQTFDPKTNTLCYYFDCTGTEKVKLLNGAADFVMECGWECSAKEVPDTWGGSREFVELKISW
jgi:hypothetical protein